MQDQFSRISLMFGDEAMKRIHGSRIAVFGIGGVGGYAVEVLVRSGVGQMDLFDNDVVNETNLNRQIIATYNTIGQYKVDAAEERIKSIYNDCKVNKHILFYSKDNSDLIDLKAFDYVIDCIDTMKSKIELIRNCKISSTPIISSLGTARKMDPTQFRIADIKETSVDPIAKILRKELKTIGIDDLKVVYSKERPIEISRSDNMNKILPSNAFVPSVAGIILAGEVIKDIAYNR